MKICDPVQFDSWQRAAAQNIISALDRNAITLKAAKAYIFAYCGVDITARTKVAFIRSLSYHMCSGA